MGISRRNIFKWTLSATLVSLFTGSRLLAQTSGSTEHDRQKEIASDDSSSDNNTSVVNRSDEVNSNQKTLIVDTFSSIKTLSKTSQSRIQTRGHHILGVGSAIYIKDSTHGVPSTGNEYKIYDSGGDGWVLDKQQKIDAKMFGLVGHGKDDIDETEVFSNILQLSSQLGIKINFSKGIKGYYLLGQVLVPDKTNLEFDENVQIKARDDLKQGHDQKESFEVLFRFLNTSGALWKCNGAKFYYDKSEYDGEHNHIFMFDGASDIFLHDPNAFSSAGDGYYVGGRFSTKKHCQNIHLIRPLASKPRRNCLSVISCDGLYVYDYNFEGAGQNGHNSSGPCAGIDVEPETYTDALNLNFYNGVTKNSLRPGAVISLTKLQPSVKVNITFENPTSINDSRGFELTRVKENHQGLVKLINPTVVKSRYASYHGLNCAADGVLFEMINPVAIDPSTSMDEKYCGGAAYYFNNYNDGSKADIYPQKIGAVKIVNPAIKFVDSTDKPAYCVRCSVITASIRKVSNIQIDNVTVINPQFKKTDYSKDVFNISAPSGVRYKTFQNVHFEMQSKYQ